MEAFGSILGMVTLALLTCLTLLIARRPLEQVDLRLRTEPLKSAAVGLLGFLSSVPLIVVVLGILFMVSLVLVVLLVGCLLLVLLPFFAMALVLALMLALVLGYSASAYRVGRWLEERYGRSFGGPYAAALVGVLVIQVWSVIGHLLSWGPGVLDVFANHVPAVRRGSCSSRPGWWASAPSSWPASGLREVRAAGPGPGDDPTASAPGAYGGDLPLTTERLWEEPPPPER